MKKKIILSLSLLMALFLLPSMLLPTLLTMNLIWAQTKVVLSSSE